MDSAKTTMDCQNISAKFERIRDAEQTQWLPYYYAALALTTPAWTDQARDKDQNAEKINAIIAKAEAIQKNAELYSLKYISATQHLLVDPQQRFMTYGMQLHNFMTEGLSLEPNNPRLLFLKGSSEFNTPEQFGGGKKVAKETLQKAISAYDAEIPQPLYPHWGRERAQELLEACDI